MGGEGVGGGVGGATHAVDASPTPDLLSMTASGVVEVCSSASKTSAGVRLVSDAPRIPAARPATSSSKWGERGEVEGGDSIRKWRWVENV